MNDASRPPGTRTAQPHLVLSVEAMRQADERTMQEVGIDGFTLMETAGRGVVDAMRRHLGELAGRRILVLCGKGNNGGDGFVIARVLDAQGASVHVVHVAPIADSTPDARRQAGILAHSPRVEVSPFTTLDDLPECDVIVDALLGIGVTSRLRSPIDQLVGWMNGQRVPIVAVDVPTGLNGDTGETYGLTAEATLTVSMAALKTGLLLGEGPAHVGTLSTVDIGIPRHVAETARATYGGALVATEGVIRAWRPERSRYAHKFSVGQVLSVAGSKAYPGAAVLACEAAAAIGAGYVVCCAPEPAVPALQAHFTDIAVVGLPATDAGTVAVSALDAVHARTAKARALLVGCGLGRHGDTDEFVRHLIGSTTLPGVLDADGLNAVAPVIDELDFAGRWVLTPHLGELRRLTGREDLSTASRLELAVEYAARWNA
ncbi:MAG: NAD(P)H-hydrate epimerase, partial [Bacteroidota bacterium]